MPKARNGMSDHSSPGQSASDVRFHGSVRASQLHVGYKIIRMLTGIMGEIRHLG